MCGNLGAMMLNLLSPRGIRAGSWQHAQDLSHLPPLSLQIFNGLVQTTGWPSVVTCVGNWFGKGK